jgi:hypothetical protein
MTGNATAVTNANCASNTAGNGRWRWMNRLRASPSPSSTPVKVRHSVRERVRFEPPDRPVDRGGRYERGAQSQVERVHQRRVQDHLRHEGNAQHRVGAQAARADPHATKLVTTMVLARVVVAQPEHQLRSSTRPSAMVSTREHRCSTIATSCDTKTIVNSRCSASCSSKAMIWACADTSRADTGSSSNSSSGSSASARAKFTLWRWARRELAGAMRGQRAG